MEIVAAFIAGAAVGGLVVWNLVFRAIEEYAAERTPTRGLFADSDALKRTGYLRGMPWGAPPPPPKERD